MATTNHTISTDGRKSALTPEQKLQRVARAFLTYKLLQVKINLLEVDRYEMEEYETYLVHHKWQRRIGTLYTRHAAVGRYIERLTAPAGGAE